MPSMTDNFVVGGVKLTIKGQCAKSASHSKFSEYFCDVTAQSETVDVF